MKDIYDLLLNGKKNRNPILKSDPKLYIYMHIYMCVFVYLGAGKKTKRIIKFKMLIMIISDSWDF